MTLQLHMISFRYAGDNAYNVLHAGQTPTAEQRAALDEWLEGLKKPCDFCNGNGWFYSDPDLGPCGCRPKTTDELDILG